MKQFLMAAAAGAVLALGACATATPYQPVGATSVRGGYSDERIESDRYRVSFSGNSVTSRDTVEMYMLYRAAELTLENGYDCFAADNRATDSHTRYVGGSDPYWSGSHWGPYWRPYWRVYGGSGWGAWGPGWGDDWDMRQITRYEASGEIHLSHGACPPDDRYSFTAREVIENLGPRVLRPVPTGQ